MIYKLSLNHDGSRIPLIMACNTCYKTNCSCSELLKHATVPGVLASISLKCYVCQKKVCVCFENAQRIAYKLIKATIIECKRQNEITIFHVLRKDKNYHYELNFNNTQCLRLITPGEYETLCYGAIKIDTLNNQKIKYAFVIVGKLVIATKAKTYHVFGKKNKSIPKDKYLEYRMMYRMDHF